MSDFSPCARGLRSGVVFGLALLAAFGARAADPQATAGPTSAPTASPAGDAASVTAAPEPAAAGTAEDPLRLETSTIKGHTGLPRVLYIVPWKRSSAGDLAGRPASSLLDDVLAPVDRAEFRRELRYSDSLAANAAAAPPESAGPKASVPTASDPTTRRTTGE